MHEIRHRGRDASLFLDDATVGNSRGAWSRRDNISP